MKTRYRVLSLRARRGGFTLIEIILVVMIIMTLAAVIGPRLVGKSKKAKVNTTKIQMSALKTTLQAFEVNCDRFPTTSEGLKALLTRPSSIPESRWEDKYVDSMPLDAWRKEFKYTCPSAHGMDYDLVSAGSDDQFGTKDDITNYAEAGSGDD